MSRSPVSSFRRHEWLADSWLVIPGAYVVAALVLGLVLPELDALGFEPFSLTIQAGTASAVLSTTAAGMIAFTGLVVSVTVVVVQFGASQYTPRLVRHFQRDPLVKHAVGFFIAPSLYAIVSLRAISADIEAPTRSMVVTVCVLLLVAAMFAFFVLIRRMLDLLRPRRLYAQLARGCKEAVLEVYPRLEAEARPDGAHAADLAPQQAVLHHRGASGVLSAIDLPLLSSVAADADCQIELLWPIGSYVPHDAPLYRLRAQAPVEIDPDALRHGFSIAEERTITQDPSFAIRAIVDIALRALSRAINDPTTAVQGLDVLEEVLQLIATRDLAAGREHDPEGRLRVSYPVAGWDELIDLALTEIRHYGANAPQIARRLRALLLGLHTLAPVRRAPAIERHIALLDAAVERSYSDPVERQFALAGDHLGIGGGLLPSVD